MSISEGDCRPERSHQVAGRRVSGFKTVCDIADGGDQTVHDLAENTASSLDLIKKCCGRKSFGLRIN